MKNRTWIIIFSSVVFICFILWGFISNLSGAAQLVGIYHNGILVEKIDLNLVTNEREIEITGDCGVNVVVVNNGKIKMESAECPDKICVKHGELQNGGTPIVCLPNKIVIKFENEVSDTDAKTGAIK